MHDYRKVAVQVACCWNHPVTVSSLSFGFVHVVAGTTKCLLVHMAHAIPSCKNALLLTSALTPHQYACSLASDAESENARQCHALYMRGCRPCNVMRVHTSGWLAAAQYGSALQVNALPPLALALGFNPSSAIPFTMII